MSENNNKKDWKKLVGLSGVLAILAAAVFIYVSTMYVPRHTVQEVPVQVPMDEEPEESISEDEDQVEPEIEAELPEEPESIEEDIEEKQEEVPEDTSSEYQRGWYYQDIKERYDLAENSPEELEVMYDEAKRMMRDPAYENMFQFSFIPTDWELYVLDVFTMADGTVKYIYSWKGTELLYALQKDSESQPFRAMDVGYMRSSEYYPLKFNNGVPSNAEEIYEKLLYVDGLTYQACETDYKEGDTTITIINAFNRSEVYPDIQL